MPKATYIEVACAWALAASFASLGWSIWKEARDVANR